MINDTTPILVTLPREIWKRLPPRYDQDYWVSNYGRIFSMKRWRGTPWRILKPNWILHRVRVSKIAAYLVAELFVPNPWGYHYVHHINGDLSDNSAENLRWADKSEFDRDGNYIWRRPKETECEEYHLREPLSDQEVADYFDSLCAAYTSHAP